MTNTLQNLLKLAEEVWQLLDRLKLYLSVQDRLWRLSTLLVHPTPFCPSCAHIGKLICTTLGECYNIPSKEIFAIERDRLRKQRCLSWMSSHKSSGKTIRGLVRGVVQSGPWFLLCEILSFLPRILRQYYRGSLYTKRLKNDLWRTNLPMVNRARYRMVNEGKDTGCLEGRKNRMWEWEHGRKKGE